MPSAEQLAQMGFVECLNEGCGVWVEPGNVPGPVRCPGCERIVAAGECCSRCGQPLAEAVAVRRCSAHHIEWVKERRKRAQERSGGRGRVVLEDRHRRPVPASRGRAA